MGDWPTGWTRGDRPRTQGSSAAGSRGLPPELDPRRPALPPELDPRGGRPRRAAPAGPARTGAERAAEAYGPQGRPGGGGPERARGTATAPPAPPGARPGTAGSGGSPGRRRRRLRPGRVLLVLLLVVVLAYGGLALWANGRLRHEDALSGRAGTAGTTWLVVGSDSREGLTREEQNALSTGRTEGRRTDTIMLLHVPDGGRPTLVSLPRDSWVDVPGQGEAKLNAAFALGGSPLLVETVEQATGLTVDHVVEIGFGGVVDVVDAVGGVEVCVPDPIQDERSGLDLPAGCQELDGGTSLSYVRARYFDPTGDLGRIRRQQQFVGALVSEVFSPGTLLNPVRQVRLVAAGTDAVTVDEDTGVVDLTGLARAFRAVSGGDGGLTTVPVADPDYRVGGQSAVLWDDEAAAQLFADLEAGRSPEPVG
ncbi:LCP family protein [Vallicoccus soli]|uniref:LytR family transcriptional regulator n=1 Tax=Vallicoccus soli TaxID=2339232 RepID=A0A3A3YZ73_9ACTN|nr:LCP family protein [Vallicoccus soli]RJK95359.1 LytR family transcriptional regulator [Vallicoccus soli]